MSGYWARRNQEVQAAIADKTIAQTEKQLAKYYASAMKKVIEDFEAVYDKILAAKSKDEQVTPADLYKLDRYWQMQGQLKQELQKLGELEIALLSEAFEEEWQDVYEATAVPSDVEFATISTQSARAMVDTVWLADGKNFSQRIWGNTEKLAATLNEQLVHCVVTGKKTTELRDLLRQRFNVSINQANTLIRTEAAHIQIEASKQRYQDYGLDKYEFHADTDDRTCKHGADSCASLDGKVFLLSEMKPGVNAPPMHPRCRCSVLPVIDDEREKEMNEEKKDVKRCALCGKEFTKRNAKANNQKYCDECFEDRAWDRSPEGRRVNRRFQKKLDEGMDYDKAWDEAWDEVFNKPKKSNPYEVEYSFYQSLYRKAANDSEKRKLNRWYNEGILGKHSGICKGCGEPFIKSANKSQYCDECKRKKKKKKKN